MSYEQIKRLSPTHFKRYCGVKPATFPRMCEVVRAENTRRQKKPGRPPKLAIEDQILLTLEYWREYRTQFHMAHRWGLSEPTVCRIITKVEDILKQCTQFRLPGKKHLRESDNRIEVIVVDATETPIERPKKAAAVLFGQEEAAPHQVASNRQSQNARSDLHPPYAGQDA